MMKKTLLVIVITVLTFGNLQAQSPEVYFGVKVGPNISNFVFSGTDAERFKDMSKAKLASHFGVFAEIALTDYFSLQPELLYSIKGARFRIDADEDFKSAYVLKYISLPVVAKYYVTKNVSVELGPQIAYLLSAKNHEASDRLATNIGHETGSEDLKDIIQDFDFGITAGATYLTKTGFYLGARYNFGILNARKPQEGIDANMHNGTFQLSFGFSFR